MPSASSNIRTPMLVSAYPEASSPRNTIALGVHDVVVHRVNRQRPVDRDLGFFDDRVPDAFRDRVHEVSDAGQSAVYLAAPDHLA
jgi:hypothetical protein